MDYKKVEEYFIENNASKEIEAKYKDYHMKWIFEGFEELINETRFASRISLSLDFEMGGDVFDDIDVYVAKVRDWFLTLKKSIQNYLDEVKNQDGKVARIYLDFLNNFYKNFKDYINDALIPYVYSSVFHKPVTHATIQYDPQRFMASRFDKLELKMMKKFKEYLKQIEDSVDKDKEVFTILIQSYDEKIEQAEKEYHSNKKLAQL